MTQGLQCHLADRSPRSAVVEVGGYDPSRGTRQTAYRLRRGGIGRFRRGAQGVHSRPGRASITDDTEEDGRRGDRIIPPADADAAQARPEGPLEGPPTRP